MAYHNLPPFGPNAEFAPAADARGWAEADGTLEQLGRSLKVDSESFKDPDEPVRAIPDPWAQPRTLGEAVIDASHSMHRLALGQWRALLAILALRELRSASYALTPRPVTLDGSLLFDRVLKHLKPQVAMGRQAALWAQPCLLMIEPAGRRPQPLAMLNPICLVSPGRVGSTIQLPFIPWARAGLTDPLALTGVDALSVTELKVLEQWLIALAGSLDGFTDPISRRIRDLLAKYAIACDVSSARMEMTVQPGIHLELPELYRGLWITVLPQAAPDPAALSRTRLRLDPRLGLGSFKGIILVDPAIGNLPNYDPRKTFVWGHRTLAELLGSEELFGQTRDAAARAGYLLVRPRDLFTERAVRLANNAVVRSHPAALQDTLLPLRPLALLLKGSLKDEVSAQSSASRLAVTLNVILEDGSDAGRRHGVTQHYQTDATSGGHLLATADWSVHNATLWPDFRSDAWRTYAMRFTYVMANRGGMVRPDQSLSAALIAEEIAEAGDANAAILRLGDLNAGRRPIERPGRFVRSERSSVVYEDIQYSSHAPDAILYIDDFPDRGEAPAGLVLIDLPVRSPKAVPTKVAVDFGTTNTVACFADKMPIRFEERLLFPIVFQNPEITRNSKHAQRWVLSKFLPPALRHTPTPTVALTREEASTTDFFAFRNIIYFHSNQRHAQNGEASELKEFDRIASDAKFNLKWSDAPADVWAATDFLEQFMLMVAAEALVQDRDPRLLLWRFSVPDSLRGRQLEGFEDHLRAITRRISTNVPEGGSATALGRLHSEGLSAACYILEEAGFQPQPLNIVLDIGGGTTDATIWKYKKLIWKGSFKIAGQNFFTRAISQNPEILKPIGLDHWTGFFDPAQRTEQTIKADKLPHLAEMLFSGPALQDAIDKHWETSLNIDTGKALRITALVFLGGLAWYLGLVVKELLTDTSEDRLTENDAAQAAFALCGRGAGIFKKMHGARDADAGSDVTRALHVYARAAGLENASRPQVFTTPNKDAKLEVVRGMISDGNLINTEIQAQTDAKEVLPAGIGISFIEAPPFVPDTLVSHAAPSAAPSGVDLAGLDAYLAALEDLDDIRVDLMTTRGQGAATQIAGDVRTYLEKASSDPDANKRFDPPFIVALRALVDQLAQPAAVRKTRLTMDFTT